MLNNQGNQEMELVKGLSSILSTDPSNPNKKVVEVVVNLVQAAKGGDQDASKQLQGLIQLTQAAQKGDQNAVGQLEKIKQQFEQQSTQMAKQGAKLNYIKKLLGKCPEGFEMERFAVGGVIKTKCKKCEAKQEKEVPLKKQSSAVEDFKQGGKPKNQEGGNMGQSYKVGGKKLAVSKKKQTGGNLTGAFGQGNGGPQHDRQVK